MSQNIITKYLQSKIKQKDEHLINMQGFAKTNKVPIITPEVAQLISVICKIKKPKNILELGTAIGYSAIILAKEMEKGGEITTIEKSPEMISLAKEFIKKAGFENNIKIIGGDALEVLKYLNGSYDLIFLDAAKGHYIDFLPHLLRLLNKGGVLVSDNILYKGMVADDKLVVRRKITIVRRLREYLSKITSIDELETTILPIGDGVSVSYKN